MTDYNIYHFTKKEWLLESVRATVILSFTGFLFFESIFGVLVLLPAAIVLMKDRKERKKEGRLLEIRNDFKEFLSSFSSSVQAGYTMEQAVKIGMEDLQRLHPKEGRAMVE